MISLLVTLVVVGLLLYLLGLLSIDPAIMNIIRVIVIVLVIIWLLGALTGYGPRWGYGLR